MIIAAALFDFINVGRVGVTEWELSIDQRFFYPGPDRLFLFIMRMMFSILTGLIGYTPIKLGSYLDDVTEESSRMLRGVVSRWH